MPAEDTSYAPRSPDLSAYALPVPQQSNTTTTTYSPSYSNYNSQYYPAQSPSRYSSYNHSHSHSPYPSAYAAQSPSSYTPSSSFYQSQSQQNQQQAYTPSHPHSHSQSHQYAPSRDTNPYADMPPVTRRSLAVKKEEHPDRAYSHHQPPTHQTQVKVKDEFRDRDTSQSVKREHPHPQIHPQIQSQPNEIEMKIEHVEEKPLPAMFHIDVKTKFPVARIKRIMQADEDVGKVAQITPTAVSKALELFMISLVTQSADVAKQKSSKKITAQHIKHVVRQTESFDFLADIIGKIPDVAPKEKEEGKEGKEGKEGGKRKRKAHNGGGAGSEED